MTTTPEIRTSETHPLQLSEIALPETHASQSLAITLFPGKKEFAPRGTWDRDLDVDLKVIRDWKPTDIIVIPSAKEQLNIGARITPKDLRAAGIFADLHQAAEAQWPCPKNHLARDIDALPVLMTTPGRRVLIIGRYGQERSAVLAVEILMRDGVYRDLQAAKSAVRTGREGSLETVAQHEYLDRYWKRRRLKGGPTYSSCPIETYKARATRLRNTFSTQGVMLSHSQALERVAQMEGLKNWSTLRARLQREQIGGEAPTQVSARWSLLRMLELSLGMQQIEGLEGRIKSDQPYLPPREDRTMLERYRDCGLSPDAPGFFAQRRRDLAWSIVEGARSFFGEDDPDIFERINDASNLGIGIPPHLVAKGGYKDISDVPHHVLLEISESPGLLELIVLHEAGYGTVNGREHLRTAALVLFGFDIQKAINGVDHISDAGKEHFGMGVLALKHAFKGINPLL